MVFKTVSDWLWGWWLIVLLLGTHLFLTIRLKVPQRKLFTAIKLSIARDKGASGDVSQFAALATSLAATLGTGNIIGVATAVAAGGPGAVFWCWLTGILGIATKYGEGLLAIKYRVQTPQGKMLGGPMYALERGLGMKWLGITFAALTALAAFGIGNTVQVNSISLLLNENYNVNPHITAIAVSSLVAMVIIFGLKGISKICSALVPIMAILYIFGCLYILGLNWEYMGETINLIFESAFTPRAAGGGFLGSTILMAARYGIARGLFSNESGLGSAPIVAAAAQTRNPVRQALVSSTGTFWDTVVVCALTGLVLVSSIIAHPEIDYSLKGALTNAAFSKIPYVGTTILAVGIITFAFSTILGWTYYAERCIEYLGGHKWIKYYRIVWIAVLYIGAVLQLNVVWYLADGLNALMAIPNIISLLLLSGVIAKETNIYLWSGKLDDVAPPPPIEE